MLSKLLDKFRKKSPKRNKDTGTSLERYIKIIIAPRSATIHNNNVAELAVSLAIFAKGWISVVIKSTVASIAELITSHDAIRPHIVIINNHSNSLILKIKPKITAKIVAIKIIIILCSFFMQ